MLCSSDPQAKQDGNLREASALGFGDGSGVDFGKAPAGLGACVDGPGIVPGPDFNFGSAIARTVGGRLGLPL